MESPEHPVQQGSQNHLSVISDAIGVTEGVPDAKDTDIIAAMTTGTADDFEETALGTVATRFFGGGDRPSSSAELILLDGLGLDWDNAGAISSSGDADENLEEGAPKRARIDFEDVSEGAAQDHGLLKPKSKAGVGLENLALKTTDTKQFKLPWEKGVFSKIFSDKPWSKLSGPKLSPGCSGAASLVIQVDENESLEPKIKFKEPPEVLGHFQHAVKKASDLTAQTVRAKKRAQAIEDWWSLISTRLGASTVGRQIQVDATPDTVHEIALEILDACFALKSPGTLYKRYYGLKGFFDWHRRWFGLDWLPMTEGKAWSYVKNLKESAAPATKASAFIEACRFSWYILGLDGTGDVESSLRVRGVSAQMKAKKRPWSPADVLSILEVRKLRSVLSDEKFHVIDRLFCGHALHLLYSRSRWSDLVGAQNVYVDEDNAFLELKTQQHKGAVSAEMKSRLLPIITPCVGVVEGDWVSVYLQLRKSCNLQLPGETPAPMLPAPAGPDGFDWHQRPLSSEEGSEFLRSILGVYKSSGRRISTHSLKTTSLSWTSKFGLSLESRALLARHASSLASCLSLFAGFTFCSDEGVYRSISCHEVPGV